MSEFSGWCIACFMLCASISNVLGNIRMNKLEKRIKELEEKNNG